jgi:hypothetical protein
MLALVSDAVNGKTPTTEVVSITSQTDVQSACSNSTSAMHPTTLTHTDTASTQSVFNTTASTASATWNLQSVHALMGILLVVVYHHMLEVCLHLHYHDQVTKTKTISRYSEFKVCYYKYYVVMY